MYDLLVTERKRFASPVPPIFGGGHIDVSHVGALTRQFSASSKAGKNDRILCRCTVLFVLMFLSR